ncbi:HNH endonuclease [Porcipelethomonas ammoniilytica]|uniref:HNH endonuclease n=1 Tax=Porcipelethomonas ammoniilytica TaxID=2981722 RepID=UPI000821168A|nr:HNH endonuclease [Porcipelethomonas ammoniilytica]MCU6720580.1 HNH endonuclease [Porcipelethomonas ammoniilytica]SCJ17807.1 HNH endonuclease [uncultured Ruminococcus sp.]
MRVHINNIIVRRQNVVSKSDYKDYRQELREDFCCICGYCGKSEKITKNAFEIDHFMPKSVAPELEKEYSNLVYSCYTCNRKKSDKWPTKDKSKCNDGFIGFVDPASEDYDNHLTRLDDGTIKGITEVGKYMCDIVFKFQMRPMRELWLCTKILERQEQLEEKILQMTTEESKEYIKLNVELKKLTALLFTKRE